MMPMQPERKWSLLLNVHKQIGRFVFDVFGFPQPPERPDEDFENDFCADLQALRFFQNFGAFPRWSQSFDSVRKLVPGENRFGRSGNLGLFDEVLYFHDLKPGAQSDQMLFQHLKIFDQYGAGFPKLFDHSIGLRSSNP